MTNLEQNHENLQELGYTPELKVYYHSMMFGSWC
jgi:hypothetical protein